MLYILKAAITLALLYSCFFVFLSKETFHRFNRCMLVGIMLVSLIMPLCHFTTQHPTVLNEEVYEMQTYIEQDTTPIVITASKDTRITWMQALTWLYLAGVAIMLILTLLQACSLVRFLHGGIRHTDGRGNTIILHNRDVSPFSIFRYIVMSVKDYESDRQYILAHEQEHIRLGHTYDLLLCEAMKTLLWFNPFIWFLNRDLKTIHEYEADQAVINQGIDAQSYQQLLVMKVVGDRLQPFTNNLNHGSLKKRIFMMYQKPSNRWLMLKAICAVPVVALTINAFATPAETNPIEDMVKTLETKEVPVLNEVKNQLPATETEADNTTNNAPFTLEEQPTDLASDAKKPLFVVDGKVIDIDASQLGKDLKDMDEEELSKLLSIKTDDITSIDVLTGVSATALFGEKAKDGAVVIKTKTSQEKPNGNDDSSEVFLVAEEPAKYPGGQEALMQFMNQNLRYPAIAKEKGVQGRVLVKFIVNKDGTCSDFQIFNSHANTPPNANVTVTAQKGLADPEAEKKAQTEKEANKALEEEAIRVCSLMPKWEPAKQRGQSVRLQCAIPVTFHLQ
ncbi:MAG: M56 family metallopeptidase [Bacteroidaceae bacterium]|nr:M56 family metallopeptidase [Bacteroidaceae bacterium]